MITLQKILTSLTLLRMTGVSFRAPLLSFRAKSRNLILIAGLTGNLMFCCRSADDTYLSDYVSTLVGTQSDWTFSTGNTYPAIALPWGMNF